MTDFKEKWPNFFIVGAPKSGTTSLYEYLKQVPEIFSINKRAKFFSINLEPNLLLTKPIRDQEKYLSLYRSGKNKKFLGDASPTYLWDPDAPKLISEKTPNAKIVVLLRNPVTRAFSHYLFLVSFGSETLDFESAIKKSLSFKNDYQGRIIEGGLYEKQIKNYLRFFKREQIHFIVFEEFIKNTENSLKDLLKFINLDYNIANIDLKKLTMNSLYQETNWLYHDAKYFLRTLVRNFIPTNFLDHLKIIFDKSAEKPQMSDSTKNELYEIYRNDISYVQNLLGKNLPW